MTCGHSARWTLAILATVVAAICLDAAGARELATPPGNWTGTWTLRFRPDPALWNCSIGTRREERWNVAVDGDDLVISSPDGPMRAVRGDDRSSFVIRRHDAHGGAVCELSLTAAPDRLAGWWFAADERGCVRFWRVEGYRGESWPK